MIVGLEGFPITYLMDSMKLTGCKFYKILAKRSNIGNIGADELCKKGFNAITIDGG